MQFHGDTLDYDFIELIDVTDVTRVQFTVRKKIWLFPIKIADGIRNNCSRSETSALMADVGRNWMRRHVTPLIRRVGWFTYTYKYIEIQIDILANRTRNNEKKNNKCKFVCMMVAIQPTRLNETKVGQMLIASLDSHQEKYGIKIEGTG